MNSLYRDEKDGPAGQGGEKNDLLAAFENK
jgi:hypothetical protein